MAEALARIDTPLFIIDPLPNNCPVSLPERLPRFLQILRKAKPHTPILLVEPLVGDAAFVGRSTRRHKNLVLRDCIDAQRAAGMQGLHLAGYADWYAAMVVPLMPAIRMTWGLSDGASTGRAVRPLL